MKPIFEVKQRTSGKTIEGDVGAITDTTAEWNNELFTTFLQEGDALQFQVDPTDGPFIQNLKAYCKLSGTSQAYLHCQGGTINDVRCGFFMTRHKPAALFAEGWFPGEYSVINISGFVLTLQESTKEAIRSNVVPHLHITLGRGKRPILGGHLIEAESGNFTCQIIPLVGPNLTRETNPETGVMHIRADTQGARGNVLLFTFAPGEIFPHKLADMLRMHNIAGGTITFAIGTLWKAQMKSDHGIQHLNPSDGLEVTLTEGTLSYKEGKFSHDLDVLLIDRYGRATRGELLQGEVKDLIEGTMRIE